MRAVLWDQRPRRNDPLWAKPSPHLTREVVTRCNREAGFVLYTHDHGATEGIWMPKDPARPGTLQQSPLPLFHPITRIEAIGSYYRRKLREFFIVTVELKIRPEFVAKAGEDKMQRFVGKMQSPEAAHAASQAVEEAVRTHLEKYARTVNLDGFGWLIEIKAQTGWQPLGMQAG